ncbi:DUF4232 domain-containing protein [Rhodococcus olei]|uniref:DUF4232 domain-containing protein n=1 Tax=Rhodococcus olei TaxID=2161675 RepID=A0ABP8NR94_9NOCA
MTRRTVARWAAAAAGAVAVAALAACGSDGSTESVTTSPFAPATGSGTAASTTASPVAVAAGCTASDLSLRLGREEGSAGSVTIPIVFTNTGGRACTLHGFPGVSYVTGEKGTEVGAAASQSGDTGTAVSLSPGGRASATVRAVQVLNYPADKCDPTPVAGLRVYPPNTEDALYAARPGTGCAQYGVDQLQVTSAAAQ